MDHRADPVHIAPLERLEPALNRVRAVERTGQRRVQIDHGSGGRHQVEERIPKDVHPSGQHDDVRPCAQNDARDFGVVRVARSRSRLGLLPTLALRRSGGRGGRGRGGLEIRLEREVPSRDRRVGRLRAHEAVRCLAVGDYERDARVGQRGRVLRIDESLKIRPCGVGRRGRTVVRGV